MVQRSGENMRLYNSYSQVFFLQPSHRQERKNVEPFKRYTDKQKYMGKEGCIEHMGPPCSSAGEESTCNVGDMGSIPELGRSPGEGKGHPLQYSGLENSINCVVHGVTKSWTRLSNFQEHIVLTYWFIFN